MKLTKAVLVGCCAVVSASVALSRTYEIRPDVPSVAPGESEAAGTTCPPLMLYDTHGSKDEGEWTAVTEEGYRPENVRDLVIDNGFVRASYEYLNEDQEGSHTLHLWDGAEWRRVTSSWYGDYTYWVSTVDDEAADAVVSRWEPGAIEVTYKFEHEPEFLVPYVHLVKKVALQPCAPGMFVKFESTPRNPPGEREFGIGHAAPVTFSERAVGFHPHVGRHVNLGLLGAAGMTWAASVGEDDLLRVMTLLRPMLTMSYQFDMQNTGRVIVNKFDEADGEVDYQAFLGATPIDASSVISEAEAGVGTVTFDATVSGGAYLTIGFQNHTVLDFVVPEDGSYALWARSRSNVESELLVEVDGGSNVAMGSVATTFEMTPLGEIDLPEGEHTLKITALSATTDIDAIVALPIGRARQVANAGARRLDN